jgi:Polysaccharide lyase
LWCWALPAGASAASCPDLRLGWETGDASQFEAVQHDPRIPLGEALEVVSSPVRSGDHAGRFTARLGQNWARSTEFDAVAAIATSGEQIGDEHWYGFSMLFPEGFPPPSQWALPIEWVPVNQAAYAGPTRIGFTITPRKELNVALNTGDLDAGGPEGTFQVERRILPSLNEGRWNDFVVHIRWASDDTGTMSIWHRTAGERTHDKVFAMRGHPTTVTNAAHGPATSQVVVGLYRSPTAAEAVVYHDAFRRGDTLASVVGSCA